MKIKGFEGAVKEFIAMLIGIATTQPTKQNKTKQFGCSGIIIGKNPPHHHPHHTGCDYILSHFQAA